MKDVLKALWRGDVSLGKTFWLWGVLGGFIPVILVMIWGSTLPQGELEKILPEDAILYPDSPLPVVIFTVAMAAYQLFIAVSIWRSAGKYQGFKLWFVLARISTLGTFYTWARSGIIYFSAWAKVGLIYFTS